MWLEDVDPDNEASRELIMQALDDAAGAENCTSADEPSATDDAPAATDSPTQQDAAGHSYHSGPPSLANSMPWGLMLLREAVPDHSASLAGDWEALDEKKQLTVSVDWGPLGAEMAPAQLVVRQGGIEIASASGRAPHALSVCFSIAHMAPGEASVAELSWAGGSRTLHCLAPLRAPIRLCELLSAPSAWDTLPSPATLIAPPRAGVPPLAYLPDRGIGVEMELITFATDPLISGCFSKEEQIRELLRRVGTAATQAGGEVGADVDYDVRLLEAAIARCALWTHEIDQHVMFSSTAIAKRAVEELNRAAEVHGGRAAERMSNHRPGAATVAPADDPAEGNVTSGESSRQDECTPELGGVDDVELERLHDGRIGRPTIMKSEFKSPTPEKGALNLAHRGAEELGCMVRLLRHIGAGAPALSETANGGCSLHVHVNVCHPDAGGDCLSCRELLSVYLSWVRFDMVTMRFARPWMWREPSMAPLYATGSEFAWHERGWEQGCSRNNGAKYDIPLFVNAVRELLAQPSFAQLGRREQLDLLFGSEPSTPGRRIGRYCSLNLCRLPTYGTLEFRRFQGTLDDALIVRWAHFCVAFVECFRSTDELSRLLGASSLEAAIATLRAEQERATATELMERMAGFVDASTADFFMHDSGAL